MGKFLKFCKFCCFRGICTTSCSYVPNLVNLAQFGIQKTVVDSYAILYAKSRFVWNPEGLPSKNAAAKFFVVAVQSWE